MCIISFNLYNKHVHITTKERWKFGNSTFVNILFFSLCGGKSRTLGALTDPCLPHKSNQGAL